MLRNHQLEVLVDWFEILSHVFGLFDADLDHWSCMGEESAQLVRCVCASFIEWKFENVSVGC